MSLKDCLFCDEKIIDEGLLGKTNNFYLKANLYPSSPGHVMIISRQHFSCFGEMPDDLDEEYLAFLDKTKKRIAKFFSEPIVTEQGIHGQSINHAHAHIFPSVSEIYDFSKRKMRDFVPEGIPVTRQNGLEDIKRILREDGQMLPHLEGYERFDDSWVLEGKPDDNGFLTLDWKEKDQIHSIKFSPVPVALYNQHNERGEFYLSQFAVGETFIELVYRRLLEPEIVFMSPEKMRRYGNENDVAKIDEKRGVAEVMGDAFCSGYKPNMAMTLLLRDFAVYYLNNLLGIAKERIQSN